MSRTTLGLALAQASAALVGALALPAQAEDNGWQVDTAALYYKEADNRVTAVEPVVNLKKDFGDEQVFNFKLVLDTLSGASPNGAAPANVAQTFSGPSGGNAKVTPAGKLPLDEAFEDRRVALSSSWT